MPTSGRSRCCRSAAAGGGPVRHLDGGTGRGVTAAGKLEGYPSGRSLTQREVLRLLDPTPDRRGRSAPSVSSAGWPRSSTGHGSRTWPFPTRRWPSTSGRAAGVVPAWTGRDGHPGLRRDPRRHHTDRRRRSPARRRWPDESRADRADRRDHLGLDLCDEPVGPRTSVVGEPEQPASPVRTVAATRAIEEFGDRLRNAGRVGAAGPTRTPRRRSREAVGRELAHEVGEQSNDAEQPNDTERSVTPALPTPRRRGTWDDGRLQPFIRRRPPHHPPSDGEQPPTCSSPCRRTPAGRWTSTGPPR